MKKILSIFDNYRVVSAKRLRRVTLTISEPEGPVEVTSYLTCNPSVEHTIKSATLSDFEALLQNMNYQLVGKTDGREGRTGNK